MDDLEGIMLSEISWTDKDKYQMIFYMWNLKKTKNEKQKKMSSQIREIKLVVARGGGIGSTQNG